MLFLFSGLKVQTPVRAFIPFLAFGLEHRLWEFVSIV